MGYFRELPNLLYPSFLPNKNSSLDFIEIKNLFRRAKLRDDLQNNFTVFEKYEIPMGLRPDTVAEELYGSDELDWVVSPVPLNIEIIKFHEASITNQVSLKA